MNNDKPQHTFDCGSCFNSKDGTPCAEYCRLARYIDEIPREKFELLNVSQLLHGRQQLKLGKHPSPSRDQWSQEYLRCS